MPAYCHVPTGRQTCAATLPLVPLHMPSHRRLSEAHSSHEVMENQRLVYFHCALDVRAVPGCRAAWVLAWTLLSSPSSLRAGPAPQASDQGGDRDARGYCGCRTLFDHLHALCNRRHSPIFVSSGDNLRFMSSRSVRREAHSVSRPSGKQEEEDGTSVWSGVNDR